MFSDSLDRPLGLEAGLYSCGLKCDRAIGVCRTANRFSHRPSSRTLLRRFGEYDLTIDFLAFHPVLVVKTLDLSSMRDLRTLLILAVILAATERRALAASSSSLNPVLIYLLARSNCCTKWHNNEVESATMLEFHVLASIGPS